MKPVLVIVIVAVLGYLVWERHFSHDARIDTAVRACMKSLGAEGDKGFAADQPKTPQDPAAAIAKGVTDAVTSMVQGLSGALCGTIKDACTRDFDGQICQAALARYR